MRRSLAFLGQRQWPALIALATADEPCECDLAEVPVVYPAGVVALVLAAVRQARLGRPVQVRLPSSTDVQNYLERIGFFAKLSDFAKFDPDPSSLARNRRNPAETFTEILTPADKDFDDVLDLIWNYFKRESPETLTQIYSAFEEVFRNVRDHSHPDTRPAFSCVQVQVYKHNVELAVGDLGIGFLATLHQNPDLRDLPTETAALRSALVHGQSRLGHENPIRGGGLRRVADVLQALRGELQIVSGNGTAVVHGTADALSSKPRGRSRARSRG